MFDIKKHFSHFDWPILFLTLTIFIIGIVNLYSASSVLREDGVHVFCYYKKQALWGMMGIVVLFFMFLFDYNKLKNLVWFLYGGTLVLLIWVLLFGAEVNGAKRWIDLKFFSLQPSEVAKFVIILLLAHVLSNLDEISWKNFFIVVFITIVPSFLIALQPDLGSALSLILIAAMMMLYVGVKEDVFWTVLYLMLPTFIFMWNYLKEYQKKRVLVMFDPELDPSGAGYNIIQSQIAVGSGRVWGNGYLKGAQSQFRFLPEKHTDFVWAVFAEEWGFVGCIFLVTLYSALLYCLAGVVRETKDKFAAFLAVGIFSFFFWHIFINIGMVLGILPVVGLPLPFMSYGGSFTILSFALIGLAINLSARRFIFK